MLSSALAEVTTLKYLLNDKRTKTIERSIFELELANALLTGQALKEKVGKFGPGEAGSDLESRIILVGKFIRLGNPKPAEYEASLVAFTHEIRVQIAKLPTEQQPACSRLIFHLEAELCILAAVKYYICDDRGVEFNEDSDPNSVKAVARFQSAVSRLCKPLVHDVRSPVDEEDLVCRNAVLDRVMRISPSPDKFYQDQMAELHEEFEENERADMIFACAKQLVCEIQLMRFGNPLPALLKALDFEMAQPPPASVISATGAPAVGAGKKKQAKSAKRDVAEAAAVAATEQAPSPRKQREVIAETQQPLAAAAAASEDYVPPDDFLAETQLPESEAAITTTTTTSKRLKLVDPHFKAISESVQAEAIKKSTLVDEKEKQQPPAAQTPPPLEFKSARSTVAASPTEAETSQIWEKTKVEAAATAAGPAHQTPGRIKFSAEEDKALRDGVAKHGAGRWKQILCDPQFAPIFASLKQRTAVNLKDRWRNLN